ncbi:phasin family protein [Novosphingobium sp. SG751A]|uniref:phasin family protein n=1 Tax=Novosphingobium sp. SG751A TaxID=2587000 RepID=UPI001551E86F|nr:phasin family protein [Novosphingobium sp. SG751A]NOW45080.1 phasin family protein [Novosphingobium sp. SG751A]
MSKKPTTKATFRTTRAPIAKPAAPSITPETAVEVPVETSPAIETAAVEPEIEVTPVAEEAAPVEEAPAAEEAPVEAAPQTTAVEAPFEETPAAEPEAKIEAPVAPIVAEEPVAKPVRKPAPRKVAAKAETVSPTSVPEVEAPTVEVSAQAPQPTETAAQPPRWPNIFAKEFAMSTFPSFDFAAPFQTAFSDFQEKAKAAYEKGNSVFGDYSEFAKGNVEALVESSKILAAGLQELTSAYVSEGRAGFETLTAEVKELAAAKSPTDFLKLQNDLAKKHFDDAVAAASKHSEALVKLANEAAQPISTRVTLAVEKIKAAA